MAKPKYSLETRLAVVSHYLSGKDGAQRTAARFGVERTSVRRWVRAWQLHGIDGITWKNDRHSPEFRLVVARTTLSEELSMREAAARFNISNETEPPRFCGRVFSPGIQAAIALFPTEA
ncbi:transposase, partial [Serratia quinivorans]|uniref:helix-turn-helix domain-containing protein n=1 Tax=Serratia quinivorans TaxID=137545 RepID=UPI002E77D918